MHPSLLRIIETHLWNMLKIKVNSSNSFQIKENTKARHIFNLSLSNKFFNFSFYYLGNGTWVHITFSCENTQDQIFIWKFIRRIKTDVKFFSFLWKFGIKFVALHICTCGLHRNSFINLKNCSNIALFWQIYLQNFISKISKSAPTTKVK